MPAEGMTWQQSEDLLTFGEITRIASVAASLGVSKLRLTGGEPLMRHGLPDLIRNLRAIPGIRDIALTTNGYFLTEHAAALADAGLHRINISIDSLTPATFSAIVRRDYHAAVMKGLEAAERTSLRPIKVNVVLLRGINDHEIGDLARFARERQLVVRFIEFMPIGAGDGWTPDHVVPTREVLARVAAATGVALEPLPTAHGEPAERFRFVDGSGEIGVISSVSQPFCGSCNRIRITADGHLRTCLFSLRETDLGKMLRDGASDESIAHVIEVAVYNKEEGHHINRPEFVRPDRTMSSIGG